MTVRDGDGARHPMRAQWCIKAEFAGIDWYSTRYIDEDRAQAKAEDLRDRDGVTGVEVVDL